MSSGPLFGLVFRTSLRPFLRASLRPLFKASLGPIFGAPLRPCFRASAFFLQVASALFESRPLFGPISGPLFGLLQGCSSLALLQGRGRIPDGDWCCLTKPLCVQPLRKALRDDIHLLGLCHPCARSQGRQSRPSSGPRRHSEQSHTMLPRHLQTGAIGANTMLGARM